MDNKTYQRNAREILSDDLQDIKESVSRAGRDAKDIISDRYQQSVDHLRDRSLEVRDEVINYTIEKPFKALAIAAFSGFLLGCFVRR